MPRTPVVAVPSRRGRPMKHRPFVRDANWPPNVTVVSPSPSVVGSPNDRAGRIRQLTVARSTPCDARGRSSICWSRLGSGLCSEGPRLARRRSPEPVETHELAGLDSLRAPDVRLRQNSGTAPWRIDAWVRRRGHCAQWHRRGSRLSSTLRPCCSKSSPPARCTWPIAW